MMSIIIRGPLGVGKTTIAKMIAERIGGFYLSVDSILEQHGLNVATEDAGIPLQNFLKSNRIVAQAVEQQDRPIVIDGNFYYQEQLDDLVRLLGTETCVFTLKASVDTCIARDARREKSFGEDATRAVYALVSMFDEGVVVQTQHQSMEETVASILEQLP